MKISFPLIFAVSVVAVSVFVQPVCAETVWQSEDEFVRLVSSDSKKTNAHPLKISVDALLDLLLKLEVLEADKQLTRRSRQSNESEREKVLSLFSEITAERLAEHLSAALRHARADQDVLFQVKDNTSFIGAIGKPVLTTGRVFWRRNELNIIFGSIHKTFKKKYLLGRETQLISPPVLPERGRPVYPGATVAQRGGIAFARILDVDGKRGYRRDWIIIRPEQLRMEEQASVEDADDMRTAASAKSATQDSLKARLKRLKELYEKDLITEEMYRRRVENILDQEI